MNPEPNKINQWIITGAACRRRLFYWSYVAGDEGTGVQLHGAAASGRASGVPSCRRDPRMGVPIADQQSTHRIRYSKHDWMRSNGGVVVRFGSIDETRIGRPVLRCRTEQFAIDV